MEGKAISISNRLSCEADLQMAVALGNLMKLRVLLQHRRRALELSGCPPIMPREKDHQSPATEQASAAASPLSASQPTTGNAVTPSDFCQQLAKLFQVQETEIALLQLENGCLRFVVPAELQTAGSIPLSSSATIVAHTAASKKAELYNNFPKIKHASIFETVKLTSSESLLPASPPIQKLMSAPILGLAGEVIGVLQVSRKGADLFSCGPDFTLEQLHQLEQVAQLMAKASFMQKRSGAFAR
jgi:hypothetical protein